MSSPSQRSPEWSSKPEILAPAGGRAQLEAAVWAGADAVYFGLDCGLNARVRATSFAAGELPGIMDFLHERGVRGYLTLNTLVFDEELAEAESLIRHAAQCGVDALIVQDIGLVRLARRVAPNLPLHGSTQMSISDAAGVAFAAELGVVRVVLGRELSIDEIAAIKAPAGLGIEAFVHGALCVSYSGQCFSSEAWGGRSANRGQCAQACRLPYGLLVDGQLREQGDFRYLLSPQDLMALELLPRLIRAGVCSFKIEGRLKGPDYVLATVSAYRDALDRIWSELAQGHAVADRLALERAQRRRLAQVFSRGQHATADGLTPGFLDGPQHQSLVIGRNPRHRGVFVGEVSACGARGIRTRLAGPVKRGDGLVFDSGRPQQQEVGGHIHHVLTPDGESLLGEIDQGEVELLFGSDFPIRRVHAGDLVWRTRDSALYGNAPIDPRLAHRRVPLAIAVFGGLSQPLLLTLDDGDGNRVSVHSPNTLQPASGAGLDETKIRKAIGQLGDTPLCIEQLQCDIDVAQGPLFLPPADIKAMRRAAVEQLLAARRRHRRAEGLAVDPVLPALLSSDQAPIARKPTIPTTEAATISLLCRSKAQVDAALQLGGDQEILLDFLEVHGLKEACIAVRNAGRKLIVAAPRIFKPQEQRLWRYYCRLQPDALLVRSAGLLHELRRLGGSGALLDDGETRIPALHGDFSLNAANLLSASYLLDYGLERLALTHDLNADQITALSAALPAGARARIELIAHHHLPIFHTEYCLFARFLSQGNSYRDCGRPCETHTVHVRDPAGADHLVQADIGCRNTVFNAAAQSAAPRLQDFLRAGIRHYRIELVDEPGDQVAAILGGYRDALAGRLSATELWQGLEGVPDANARAQGVGLGSLAVRIELDRSAMKKPTAR